MTAANMLTTTRLVLAPLFILLFIMREHEWAILTFSVAGFTDFIDGTIARFLKQPSTRGALLDPLADKILVQSCFICLFVSGIIPWWFFLLALGRDLLIVCGIFYLEWKKYKLPYRATWSSKFATLFQICLAVIGLLLWWQPYINIGIYSLNHFMLVLLIVTAFLLIVSGAQYVMIGLKIKAESNEQTAAQIENNL